MDCGVSTCKVAWTCTNEDCGAEEKDFNEAMVDEADFFSWGGPFCGECGSKMVGSTPSSVSSESEHLRM